MCVVNVWPVPRYRSELIDFAWVVIVPGQKCINIVCRLFNGDKNCHVGWIQFLCYLFMSTEGLLGRCCLLIRINLPSHVHIHKVTMLNFRNRNLRFREAFSTNSESENQETRKSFTVYLLISFYLLICFICNDL